MKILKLFYTLIFSVLLLTSCVKDSKILEPIIQEEYIISADATLPDSITAPRMIYTDLGYKSNGFFIAGAINAVWTGNEKIEILLRRGTTPVYAKATTVTISNIIANRCRINITVPASIVNAAGGGNIEIFAVNVGMSTTTSTQKTYISNTPNSTLISVGPASTTNLKRTLSGSAAASQPLNDAIIQTAKAIVSSPNSSTTLNFKHVGSLIAFSFYNSDPSNFYQTTFINTLSLSGSNNWVYAANQNYDLSTLAMVPTATKTNTLTFFNNQYPAIPTYTLPLNTYSTMYQWFVPAANPITANNLAVNLNIYSDENTTIKNSTVTLRNNPGNDAMATAIPINTGMRYSINRYIVPRSDNTGFLMYK